MLKYTGVNFGKFLSLSYLLINLYRCFTFLIQLIKYFMAIWFISLGF